MENSSFKKLERYRKKKEACGGFPDASILEYFILFAYARALRFLNAR